jgi:hypothetical protein
MGFFCFFTVDPELDLIEHATKKKVGQAVLFHCFGIAGIRRLSCTEQLKNHELNYRPRLKNDDIDVIDVLRVNREMEEEKQCRVKESC